MLFQRLDALWGAVKKIDFGMVQALHLLVEIRNLLKEYPRAKGTSWDTGFHVPTSTPEDETVVVEHGAKEDSVTIRGAGPPVPKLTIRNGDALCPDCGYNWKTRDALDRALRRPPMLHGAPCPICGRDKGDYE